MRHTFAPALLLTAALTGCGSTPKPHTRPPATPREATETAATPARLARGHLGQPARLNAWEITATARRAPGVTSSRYAGVPKGRPVVIVTVKLTNRSTTALPVEGFDVKVTVGAAGKDAEQVHEFDEHDLSGNVLPGRSKTAELRYVAEKQDLAQATVEVMPSGDGAPSALFDGAVA